MYANGVEIPWSPPPRYGLPGTVRGHEGVPVSGLSSARHVLCDESERRAQEGRGFVGSSWAMRGR
jgi:hypothetical protein